MDRRRFVIGTAAATSAVRFAGSAAFAQGAFPARPITILNAFPPGGINDIVTRPFVGALEPVLKQPVVVETKAGAGGQVGAQVAAGAKPDGYTLLSHNNGISGYEEVDKLYGRPAKTTRADFIPLARLATDSVLLLVNADQPYKTVKDFVDDAKAKPETLVYSSGGLYGATHLPVALLEKATGIAKMRHLPTAGGGPAITALLGKNVQLTTQTVSATLQHIKAGKLRALARVRSRTIEDIARRADAERTRLRRRICAVGRPVRSERNAGRHRCDADERHRDGREIGSVPLHHSQPGSGTRLPEPLPHSRPSGRKTPRARMRRSG